MNYEQLRTIADQQIRDKGQLSYLRRASGTRECWAVEAQLTANDRRALKNTANRVFLITAVDLTVPPDKDDAFLWTEDGVQRLFRQDAPVSPLCPGGVVLYYEIQVTGGRDV